MKVIVSRFSVTCEGQRLQIYVCISKSAAPGQILMIVVSKSSPAKALRSASDGHCLKVTR